jgi:hypothetical protein
MCVECDVFYQYVKYNMKYQYLAAQKNWQNMTSVVRVQKFKLQIMAHKSRIFSPTLFSGFWSVIFIPRVCQYTMLGHLQVTFPNGSRLSKHAHATGVTAQRGDPNGSSIPHTWATSQRCDTNGSSYMSHGPAVRRLHQWYQFSWRWQPSYMSTPREAVATLQGHCQLFKGLLPSHRCTLPGAHISALFPISRKLFMTILDAVRDHDSNTRTMSPVRLASLLTKNVSHTYIWCCWWPCWMSTYAWLSQMFLTLHRCCQSTSQWGFLGYLEAQIACIHSGRIIFLFGMDNIAGMWMGALLFLRLLSQNIFGFDILSSAWQISQ